MPHFRHLLWFNVKRVNKIVYPFKTIKGKKTALVAFYKTKECLCFITMP